MNLIIKENSPDYQGNLYRYFDGNEWVEKWDKDTEASRMVMTNHLQELEPVRKQVLDGELSPLAYHIEAKSFTISLLSSYTGITKRSIKKHFKPEHFNKLDSDTLNEYAAAFGISVAELKKV